MGRAVRRLTRRLVALTALPLALAGCGSAQAGSGISIRVSRAPFRISVLSAGRPVAVENTAAALRFQLRSSGAQYSLTRLISSHGTSYEVATSEPGRTATVSVVPRPSGVAIDVALPGCLGTGAVCGVETQSRVAYFI